MDDYHVHVERALQPPLHESVAKYPNLIRVTFSGVATDSVVTWISASIRRATRDMHDWNGTTLQKIVLDTGMYVLNVNLEVANWNFALMRSSSSRRPKAL